MIKLRYLLVSVFCSLTCSAQAQTFDSVLSDNNSANTPSPLFDNATSASHKNIAPDNQALPEPAAAPEEPQSDAVKEIQNSFFSTNNKSDDAKAQDPFALMNRDKTAKTDQEEAEKNKPAKKDIPIIEQDDDFFVPPNEIGDRINTPTVDGSERGGQAFVMVDKDGNMKKVTNIFLFYDNFQIHHAFGDYTTCDVRFNIISNMDRKLSQFDVKLVWPDITTSLSFEDVPPNTQTYYNYTLLGKGCYSMDKAPNIVVNRCRAKGITSAECARKIKWVSK